MPFRALIEEGLRRVLESSPAGRPFRLRPFGFRGEGLVGPSDWSELREIICEGRGAWGRHLTAKRFEGFWRIIAGTMTRDQAIATITQRLVEYYRPERIYLFGSAARDEHGPDSDLDFCVVVPDDAPDELVRSGAIYSVLRGMGYPKDVVPWRRSDFDARAAHVRTSLPATIVREGKLLYDSRRVAA